MHLFFEKVYHLLSIAVFMALKNQKFWFTLLLIFITTNLCFGCFFLTAAGFLFTFLWILTLAIIMSIAWPFSKTRLNIIQLTTGFEYNSSFVWPSNGSVDQRRSLRATDPFEGQKNCCCSRSQSITLLLYTFIFSKCSYSLFPPTYPWNVFRILVRQVQESGRRLDIVTSISRDLLNQWK